MEQGEVRISHRIPMADSDAGSDVGGDSESDIDADEGDALAAEPSPARTVRFACAPRIPGQQLTKTPPPEALLNGPAAADDGSAAVDDGFETVYDSFQASKLADAEDCDLGVSKKQKMRSTMSQRQLHELYLGLH